MPLPLYGSRRPKLANLRRHCAEQLPIGALQRDEHLAIHFGGHPRRQLVNDRMRIAEQKVDVGAFYLGAVADSVNFQNARVEALAHPSRHIGDKLAHQPMLGALFLGVAGTFHVQLGRGDFDGIAIGHRELELTLGTFDLDHMARENGFYALVQHHRLSAYARHVLTKPFAAKSLATKLAAALRRRLSCAALPARSLPQAAW